jgi:hypothetical protein
MDKYIASWRGRGSVAADASQNHTAGALRDVETGSVMAWRLKGDEWDNWREAVDRHDNEVLTASEIVAYDMDLIRCVCVPGGAMAFRLW